MTPVRRTSSSSCINGGPSWQKWDHAMATLSTPPRHVKRSYFFMLTYLYPSRLASATVRHSFRKSENPVPIARESFKLLRFFHWSSLEHSTQLQDSSRLLVLPTFFFYLFCLSFRSRFVLARVNFFGVKYFSPLCMVHEVNWFSSRTDTHCSYRARKIFSVTLAKVEVTGKF